MLGNKTVSHAHVFEWHQRLSEAGEEVEFQKINEIVRQDRRFRWFGNKLNTKKETVRQTVHHELNTTKVCAEMVSKSLTMSQKNNRKRMFFEVSDLLTNVITCDETYSSVWTGYKASIDGLKEPSSPRKKKNEWAI